MTINRTIRGIRDKIPSGYLLGRSAKGDGRVELIKASDLITPGGIVIPPGSGSGISQLTGDVTAGPGSGSQAATIANDAVSNAKLANMAAWTLKARNNAASGDPQDAALADFTTDTPVVGDFAVGFKSTGELRKFDFSAVVSVGSWVPTVDGSEPPVFITDGAGVLIFTFYTP